MSHREVDTEAGDAVHGARPHEPAGGERELAGALVGGAVTALLVTRVWIATLATIPRGPDSIGPWAAAFAIARAHPAIDMYDLPPYSVGMGVVLSPLVVAVADPRLRFQLAVGGLGLLVLAAGVCVARFLRRAGPVSPLAAAVSFCTVVMMTTVAFSSAWTWAEALALLWMGAWLALAAWALARRGVVAVAVVAAFSGTGTLVHGRFLAIAVVWVVVVVAAGGWRRAELHRSARERRPELVVAVVGTALSFLASSWLRVTVVDLAWSRAAYSTETDFVRSLGDPRYWWAVGKAATGQLWYAVASSAGLVLAGVWWLVRRGRTGGAAGAAAWAALVGSASVVATSVLWHGSYLMDPPPVRADYLVTGRYIDSVLVPLAALGAAALVDLARARIRWVLVASAVAVGALGAGVAFITHTSGVSPRPVLDAVVAGLASWPFDRAGRLEVLRWSALGIGATLVLVVAVSCGRRATGVAVYALLVLGTIAGSVAAAQGQSAFDNRVLYAGYPAAPRGHQRVAVAADALEGDYYRYNSPSQQYALADRGWDFFVVDEASAALAADPPDDAGMVVLVGGAPPPSGDWCTMPAAGPVVIWARLTIVAPGEAGGPCALAS